MFGPETSSKPKTPGERGFVIIFSCLVFGLFYAEMIRDFHATKVSMLLFPVFWCVLVVIHELGHALAAWSVGWRVEQIVIGFGTPLKRWQVGETLVELRAIPISGFVVPVPRSGERARLAIAFIYAAGPGIEIALVAMAAAVVGYDTLTTVGDSYSLIALQTFCGAALTGAIINLIPAEFGWRGSRRRTDGLGILTSFALTQQHFEEMALSTELRRIRQELKEGRSTEVIDELEALIEKQPQVLELYLLLSAALNNTGEKMQGLLRLQAARRMPHLLESDRAMIDQAMEVLRNGGQQTP